MPVADLRGGPNSLIFMQFSAKKEVSTPTLGVGDPPPLQENPGSATVCLFVTLSTTVLL